MQESIDRSLRSYEYSNAYAIAKEGEPKEFRALISGIGFRLVDQVVASSLKFAAR